MPMLSMSLLGGEADIPDPRVLCPLLTQSVWPRAPRGSTTEQAILLN